MTISLSLHPESRFLATQAGALFCRSRGHGSETVKRTDAVRETLLRNGSRPEARVLRGRAAREDLDRKKSAVLRSHLFWLRTVKASKAASNASVTRVRQSRDLLSEQLNRAAQGSARSRDLEPDFLQQLEVLATGAAYHRPHKRLPTVTLSQGGREVTYQVEPIRLGWGMEAYGLTPISADAQRVLVFKGTSLNPHVLGAGATVLSDIDPLGPGAVAFQASRKELRKWLDGSAQSVVATGHSLGGAMATLAGICESEKVSHVVTFNAPKCGMPAKLVWDATPEAERPNVVHFVRRGDKVPALGFYALGRSFEVLTHADTAQGPQATPEPGATLRWDSPSRHSAGMLQHIDTVRPLKRSQANPVMVALTMLVLSLAFVLAGLAITVKRMLFSCQAAKEARQAAADRASAPATTAQTNADRSVA